jgi:DNA-directed RNA polymerase specialized sigma24 family protein
MTKEQQRAADKAARRILYRCVCQFWLTSCRFNRIALHSRKSRQEGVDSRRNAARRMETLDLAFAGNPALVLQVEEWRLCKHDLSLEETAAILDIPVGAAKSRLQYGVATLRKHVTLERKPSDRVAGRDCSRPAL